MKPCVVTLRSRENSKELFYTLCSLSSGHFSCSPLAAAWPDLVQPQLPQQEEATEAGSQQQQQEDGQQSLGGQGLGAVTQAAFRRVGLPLGPQTVQLAGLPRGLQAGEAFQGIALTHYL